MKLTLATAPSIEPVTLTEARDHCRLTPDVDVSIAAGSHAVGNHEGTGIDVLNKTANVVFESGTNGTGGTVDVHIEESDDNSTYTDWSGGTFTQVTTSNDNTTYEILYTGTKKYIRAYATVGTIACIFQVRVETGDDDADLNNLIVTAREYIEALTGRRLITSTWNYFLDEWPSGNYIKIPYPTLQSVSAIYYYDTDGTETEWDSDEYIVDTDSIPGRVVLAYGETWPNTQLYPKNPIKVQYVAGYGDAASDIPKQLRQAMLLIIAELYENRQKTLVGQTIADFDKMGISIDRLVASERIIPI